jgi:hypothetical protein
MRVPRTLRTMGKGLGFLVGITALLYFVGLLMRSLFYYFVFASQTASGDLSKWALLYGFANPDSVVNLSHFGFNVWATIFTLMVITTAIGAMICVYNILLMFGYILEQILAIGACHYRR